MPSPGVQVCPFHTDEPVRPVRTASETAEYTYRCGRKNHPVAGPFEWPFVPEPERVSGDTLKLGLDVALPEAVATAAKGTGSDWVEYGLVERAYALADPKGWAKILAKFDHTGYHDGEAITRADLPYTASMYLGRTLGTLSGTGRLGHRSSPGTGRWAYNNPSSFYALPGADPFGAVATWESAEAKLSDYLPAERPK